MSSTQSIPDHAEVIIVGGGVIGVSVAYHLALYGLRDVLLLEKAELTSGCTWHAAGLVGQLRGKHSLTQLMQYSTDLFDDLEEKTGYSPGWKPVGSLRLASSPERWIEIQQMALKAKAFNIELFLVDADEAVRLFPLIDRRSIHGAAFLPDDGYVDPYGLTQSLARGFKDLGGQIHEHTQVTGFRKTGRRITAIETHDKSIQCDLVVNCAGLWARQVGEMAGCHIPAGVVEHQYLITEKSDEIPEGLPTLRDPDRNFYLKPEAGAFEFGGWEDDSIAVDSSSFPADFNRTLYNSNFDRFDQIFELTAKRIPLIRKMGVKSLINGPIPVSADGEPVMGQVGGIDNLYTACGFTAGIAASGGAGRALAEWIIEGRPSIDLWGFDIRRFGQFHAQSPYLEKRALQSYGRYYKIHWPNEEIHTDEKLRCSALYDELLNAGAVYGTKFGWKRANWFASDGENPHDVPTFAKPNWFDAVGRECHAIRNHAALIDQSSFFKFLISGPDAVAALNHLSTCNVDRLVGKVVYAQMCNEKGGIECDVVLLRIEEDKFWLITGSGFGVHDYDWVFRNTASKFDIQMQDITSDFSVINLCGPRSREVLETVTTTDVSNAAFPYLTFQIIEINGNPVTAVRLGYAGELGWELYIENRFALNVYRTLHKAGQESGIHNAGYRALDSLRLENGYLYWSGEISPYINPFEVSLDFRIDFNKSDFLGKAALENIRDVGVQRKLHCFSCDDFVPIFGGEPVMLSDEVVGSTLSGGFGHSVSKSLCYAFLPVQYEQHSEFDLQTLSGLVQVTKQKRPVFRKLRDRLNR